MSVLPVFFFLQENKSTLFSISLNPWGVQHYTASVSYGFSRKISLEFGTNHTTVSMSISYLSPDYSGLVRFATRSHCVVLGHVHISTFLAWIEFSFILSINTFNFKKIGVLSLVPETLLIASKNGLGPQPSRHICRFRNPVPSRPPQAPRWRWEKLSCFLFKTCDSNLWGFTNYKESHVHSGYVSEPFYDQKITAVGKLF